MTDYVSLHNHTHWSILDSLLSPKELLTKSKELGQKAVAITDHGTLSNVWEAYKASKDIGIKLIVGCEMYFLDSINKKDERFRHIILLAKNAIGYKNLLSLNKEGFDNSIISGKRVYPLIDWELLKKYSEGLICLTSCSNGIIGQLLMNRKIEDAEKQIFKLVEIFGKDNLGLEVQPHNLKRGSNFYNDVIEQFFVNSQMIKLAKKHGLRAVATTNAHYLNKEDAETHDVLLAIGSHQTVFSNFRLKYDVPDFYVKSGEEVKKFFERNYKDYADELVKNSVFFADQCEEPAWIDPKYSNPSGKELPEFPVHDEPDYKEFLVWKENQSEEIKKLEEDQSFLRYKCFTNFDSKLSKVEKDSINEYNARILEELDVLEYHGFSSYMLIVADFINWARKNNIAVGEGRGSVGGSLVAYLLGIHQADPIKYGLIFARFHNKDKKAYPDIDSDFAPSGKEAVQEYLKAKYGADHVVHVSNINTITPKVYVRDIARALELGGSKEAAVEIGDNVADSIDATIHSIDDALNKAPLFAEYCKKYPQFIQFKGICGKPRAWSTHAGGIIIAKRSLKGLVPIRKDKDGEVAVEYDKDKAEENGLVKIDILGLSTLDTINTTIKLIKDSGKEIPPTIIDYDAADPITYNLISNGDTFGVFQLGTSSGTIDLCKKIKPKSINDISYINSLARPSARDMRNSFIATKDGKKKFSLLHPKLGRAFNNTYGFGLYEESLMYLAQDIAGWTLNEADGLRKLTKDKGKNPKKAQALRTKFIQDSTDNKINQAIAARIWDEVVDKFQGYGFNQSHSILYSMNSYQTAYLKAHYPIEFLLANLMDEVKSNAPNAKANKEKIKKELRQHKVKILPPDINKSEMQYALVNANELLTGLDALKNVGDDAIKELVEKRPFTSFFDFMTRISSKVRANTIQALVSCGCLDSFKLPRKLMYLYCSDYRKKLKAWLKTHDASTEEFNYPWPDRTEWSKAELYALEKHYLGEAFVCGKLHAYDDFFKKSHILFPDAKKCAEKSTVQPICAEVKDFFDFKIKKQGKYYGRSMVKATIEDVKGNQCGLTIFPDQWDDLQNRIKEIYKGKYIFEEGVALNFAGVVNIYEDEIGLILDKVYNFHPVPQLPEDRKAKKVNLKLDRKNANMTLIEEMEDVLYEEGLIELDEES